VAVGQNESRRLIEIKHRITTEIHWDKNKAFLFAVITRNRASPELSLSSLLLFSTPFWTVNKGFLDQELISYLY